MEGYSVTEAASVLGVPTERVWELLARGVLAGAPDGETGMRVFLQPRPAPAPPDPVRPRQPEPQAERELSPFRELLTEFRNLTERYGQALLALGEARGEVASLRSRVDMLEARIELRLPMPGGSLAGWAAPAAPAASPPPEPALEGRAQPSAAEASGSTPAPDAAPTQPAATPETDSPEPEPRASRRSGARRATESFAEALARAEDPSLPDLPSGPDDGDVLAGVRHQAEAEPAAADAGVLPREVPPAEPMPVPEEAVPEAVAAAGAEAPEAETTEGETASPRDEALPQLAEPAAEPAEPLEPAAAAMAEPAESVEPAVAAGAEPAEPAEPEEHAGAWHDEHYTAEIAEPDWFEGEALVADEPTTLVAPASEPQAPSQPDAPADPDEATTATVPPPIAQEDDADDMEVAPTGRAVGPNAVEAAVEPNAVERGAAGRTPELEDAFAALEALSRVTPPGAADQEAARAGPEQSQPPRPWTPPSTPAGRAYRRLRRIFPG